MTNEKLVMLLKNESFFGVSKMIMIYQPD